MANKEKTPGGWGVLRILGKAVLALAVFLVIFVAVNFIKSNYLLPPPQMPSAARVQADIRTMATGIETYWIDHDAYPTEAWRMTTPIAYLSRLPLDGCSEDGTEPFCYYTDGEGYIIVSRGPDRIFQIDPVRDFKYSENNGAIAPELLGKCFDPTNGSVSAGDIFRIGSTEQTLEEREAQEKENQADDE